MRLKNMHLTSFCGFRNYWIDFAELTVLTGPNNGGKTSILTGVKLALDAFRRALGEHVRWKDVDRTRLPYQAKARGLVCGLVPGQSSTDYKNLFFKGVQSDKAQIDLVFEDAQGELTYQCGCQKEGGVELRFRRQGNEMGQEEIAEDAGVEAIYNAGCRLVNPVAQIQRSENVLEHATYLKALHEGKEESVWRNTMHWLVDGKPTARVQKVENVLKEFMEDLQVRPPSRSRTGPNVMLNYEEDGEEFDVSVGGSGLATLIYLVSVLELADERIVLVDEPDAHLHPSLQRQLADYICGHVGVDRQVVLATHAPEMIQSFPTDSLVWVDRSEAHAQTCESIPRVLADLGAVSRQAAVALRNANLLFVENRIDERALLIIAERLGKTEIAEHCQVARLHGGGDAKYLHGVARALRQVARHDVVVIGVFDSDYEPLGDRSGEQEAGPAFVHYLPCKELENLLLLQPEAIRKAADKADARRVPRRRSPLPTASEIGGKIDQLTDMPDVRQTVYSNWVRRRSPPSTEGEGLRAQQQRLVQRFEAFWSDPDTRRRYCPGKRVLVAIRRWYREEYSLSIGGTLAMFHQYDPDGEMRALLDTIVSHVRAMEPERGTGQSSGR